MPYRSSSLLRGCHRATGHAEGCSVHGRMPRELPGPGPTWFPIPARAPVRAPVRATAWLGVPCWRQLSLSSAQRCAIADLRFAAWFL